MNDLHGLISRMADELDYYRQLLTDDRREVHALAVEARAALAAEADGPASVVGEPSDEELLDIAAQSIEPYDKIRPGEYEPENNCAIEVYSSELIAFARAALARYGHQPTPVPVAERLPGPEDCLDEGWAWFFSPRVGWRQAVLPVSPAFTHWLPATALPLPQGEVE